MNFNEQITAQKFQMSEEEVVYFYLPPGSLKPSQILSIVYAPSDGSRDIKLSFEVGQRKMEVQTQSISEDGLLSWSVNDFVDFIDIRKSEFKIILGDKRVALDLNSLAIVSAESDLTYEEAPKDIVIIQFVGGYFARAEDFEPKSVKLVNLKTLNTTRREAYQRACQQYDRNRDTFQEEFKSNFEPVYVKHVGVDMARREDLKDIYHEYSNQFQNSPKIDPSFCADPITRGAARRRMSSTSEVIATARKGSRARLHTTVTPPSFTQSMLSGFDISDAPAVFPAQRDGWRAPSVQEITACLSELQLMFPLDVESNSFCGISEDDQDLNAQKLYLFNVLFFLTLFAEFTGMIYDYRITLIEGSYKLEDRVTGAEIKKDNITAKNMMSNPYRTAVLACLKKISNEFLLPVSANNFTPFLEAIFRFPMLLA